MKKLLLFLGILLLAPFSVGAQEPYAVYEDSTLTFYYDTNKDTRTGDVYTDFSYHYDYETYSNCTDWSKYHRNDIQQVVFDESFSDCSTITSTAYWFNRCSKIEVIIGVEYLNTGSVTNMGYMFSGCSSLTSLDVSNFETGNVTNMSSMFSGCNVTSLDVSNFDTGNVTNMSSMFSGCNVTSLDVSNFDTGKVTAMGWMFSSCSNLTSLDVSNFDTKKVTDMGYMFYYCSSLTSLDVSNFDTGKVTYMNSMFYKCSSLTSLDVSNFETDKVTHMSLMFYSCSSLTSLDVSNFDTGNVTSMNSMFSGCSSLTSLDVSNFETDKVTNMGSMFYNCSSMTSLDVSNFDTNKVTSMDGMFSGCSSLASLDLSNFGTGKVTNMISMFNDCTALTTIYIGEGWTTDNVQSSNYMFNNCQNLVGGDGTTYNPSYTDKTKAYAGEGGYLTMKEHEIDPRDAYAVYGNGTLTFYYDTDKDTRTGDIYTDFSYHYDEDAWDNLTEWSKNHRNDIHHVVFDSSFADCTTINSTAYWFAWCSNIEEIIGLNYLNTSNVTDMSFMFSYCWNLLNLYLSIFDTSNVTDMGWMFSSCSSLTSLDVSNFDTGKVKYMRYMFYGCSSLTSLDVSNFDTSKVMYMNSMFSGCSSLTSLDVSNFDTGYVTYMSDMFNWCSSLTSLDLSNFDTSEVAYMDCMFSGCSSLTSLDLSNFDTSEVTYMFSMFEGCNNLTSLDMSYFDTSNVTDMWYMFSGCTSLSTIYIGVGWSTDNVNFSEDMFKGCNSLIGDDGTVYDPNYTDKTKAYAGVGGYLTLKEQDSGTKEAYAVLSTFGKRLTFYYDSMKNSRQGTVINENEFLKSHDSKGWGDDDGSITAVNFVPAFMEYNGITNTAYWFYGMTNLMTINGLQYLNTANVTNMEYMFYGCTNLTKLEVSNFETSNVTSMNSMFYDCSNVTSLDVSDFDTDNVTSMSSMFSGCSSLTTIYIGEGWTTDNVEYSDDMFTGCNSLFGDDGTVYDPNYTDKTKAYAGEGGYLTLKDQEASTKEAYAVLSTDGKRLTFYYDSKKNSRQGTVFNEDKFIKSYSSRGWGDDDGNITTVNFAPAFIDYNGLTSTAYWFFNMTSLMKINGLQYLNTANVTNMSSMFYNCSDLRGLDVSKFNTYKVTSMSSMFYNCSDLRSLDVSYFDTYNVTSMSSMFYNCSSLRSLDVSNFYTSKVTYMSSMFSGCSSLKNLDVSKFNTYNVTSMNSMFSGCSSLRNLDVSNFNTGKVTDMSNMFSGCSSLRNLDVSNFDTGNVTNMNSMFYNCSSLTSLGVSNFDTNKVTSMNAMFSGCSSLTSLDVSNFNTNNVTDMSYMFKGCSSLSSLDMSDFNTGKVTNMHSMFSGCSSLTSLDVSNFDTGNVTNMNSMFYNCSSLTNLDVSNFNTGNVTNWNIMFSGCSSLTSLDVSNFDTNKVTSMNAMFSGCSSLTSLDVSNFYTDKVTNMSLMFSGCISLTSLDVSNFFTNNVTDMGSMFSGCSSLASLDLSNFDTGKVTNMSYMFNSCTALTTIYIGEGWTTDNVQSSNYMFNNCQNLVGGDGTNYDPSYTDKTKAYAGEGGYLTLIVTIDAEDFLALQSFYNAFDGDNWTALKWNFDNKRFPGVLFNDEGQVTAIYLENNGLNGSCTGNTLLALPKLGTLHLANNDLSGNVSALAGAFPMLKSLDVKGNHFTEVEPVLPSTITTLDMTCQSMEQVTESILNDFSPEQIPSLMLYNHLGQTYHTDLSFKLANYPPMVTTYQPEKPFWGFMATGLNGNTPQLTCLTSNNIYYGQSGDVFYYSYPNSSAEVANSYCKFKYDFSQGDANMYGGVNVLDLQTIINYIFEQWKTRPFNFTAANLWEDELINVQDIICLVNLLISMDTADEEQTAGSRRFAPANSVTDAVVYVQDNQLMINTCQAVAAFDITVSGTYSMNIAKALSQAGFTFSIKKQADGLHIIGYSLNGASIPAGITKIGTFDTNAASVRSVMLSDSDANAISASCGSNTTGLESVGMSTANETATYDLQGRRVNSSQLRKGLYVKKGRIIVK